MKNSNRSGIVVIAGLSALAAVATLTPRPAAGTPAPAPAVPRQVQVKFEWVASGGSAAGTPDRSVEALTFMAQEGRTAQASSQHTWNGVGVQETVSVLPRLEAGGFISLTITERIDDTASGHTASQSSQTTVRVAAGQTGLVRGLTTTQDGQMAQRMLFVTPVVVRMAQ